MKIGIITFHFVHNQGAILQCYALQEYLSQKGHEVVIINYRPGYHDYRYSRWKNPFVTAKSNWDKNPQDMFLVRFKKYGRGFIRGLKADIEGTDKFADKQFQRFISTNLNITKKYKTIRELKKNPPICEVYFSGSDQLWNTELLDRRFDEAYFLNFGAANIVRATYAVSLKEKYTQEELRKLQALSKPIDYISFREPNIEAERYINRPIHICIDPTLLLDMDSYERLRSDIKVNGDYVFVYGFETNDDLIAAVKYIVDKTGLKVLNGSPKRVKLPILCDELWNYGPDKFLSYMKNASYIVTDSFHGTVFSIIYKKSFTTALHLTRGKRMIDLLGKLGLKYRLWNDESYDGFKIINYESVGSKLDNFRRESITYIDEVIKSAYEKHNE